MIERRNFLAANTAGPAEPETHFFCRMEERDGEMFAASILNGRDESRGVQHARTQGAVRRHSFVPLDRDDRFMIASAEWAGEPLPNSLVDVPADGRVLSYFSEHDCEWMTRADALAMAAKWNAEAIANNKRDLYQGVPGEDWWVVVEIGTPSTCVPYLYIGTEDGVGSLETVRQQPARIVSPTDAERAAFPLRRD